jgi:peptidylprolyl isomerase
MIRHAAITLAFVALLTPAAMAQQQGAGQILAAAPKDHWRTVDPDRTLYMDFDRGRVIIELAPSFAPNHVENLKTLVKERYFDGLSIIRAQDNYVIQWGDPEEGEGAKPLGSAKATVPAEFTRKTTEGVVWTPLPDRDTYAEQVGMADGFPAARDPKTGETWLVHCYGTVAVARDTGADSGNGAQLYAVNGHAPRHLDRNMTVIGRVLVGMDILSSMPRGTGSLGFYTMEGQRTPIARVRFASELPEAQRIPLEALRTDTDTFARVTELRRNRTDDFFKVPAGGIDVCNVNVPLKGGN